MLEARLLDRLLVLGRRHGSLWLCRCAHSTGKAESAESSGSTHFGYQTVSEEEKKAKVHDVFEKVAEKYDLMNDLMSLSIHRWWKDQLIRRIRPRPGLHLLDIAGGTGDIAFRFLKYGQPNYQEWPPGLSQLCSLLPSSAVPDSSEKFGAYSGDEILAGPSQATVCDVNGPMLEVGRRKAIADDMLDPERLQWVEGDAENLPFEDASFHVSTVAFGIRNCTHMDKVLKQAHRVLKPGGSFFCLEFSHVQNSLLSRVYDAYSMQVIPVLGQLVAGDWRSYQYLVESIRKFPSQEEFSDLMEEAGFTNVGYENLSNGIVAIHSGWKL